MNSKDGIEESDQRNISQHIADALIAKIQDGVLSVGEPLPTERQLCEEYSTSRPTVREAIASLQVKGFAVASSGKRPRVAVPSIEDILMLAGDHIRQILGNAESAAHLEQMRQFIEAGAIRAAAEQATNIQIAQMQAALQRNYEAIGKDSFPTTDIAFHRSMVAVVGNPIILKLHDMFVSTLLSKRPDVEDRETHDAAIYEEHRKIYEAILDGDVITATGLIDRHLERSYRARLASPKSVVHHKSKRDAM